MTMTEEELETMTSMSDEDLENYYDEKLRKLHQGKESTNEDGRDVYFRVGDELVELKGLSDEDMKSIMSSSDKLITKEELNNLKQFTSGMSEEDLDLISDMTDEELEQFYQDNIATKGQRHKREINEDDLVTSDFEEDPLRISQSKVKREANPDPEPEPMGPQKETDLDYNQSNTEDQEQRFLEEYVRRFRSRGKRAISINLSANLRAGKRRGPRGPRGYRGGRRGYGGRGGFGGRYGGGGGGISIGIGAGYGNGRYGRSVPDEFEEENSDIADDISDYISENIEEHEEGGAESSLSEVRRLRHFETVKKLTH